MLFEYDILYLELKQHRTKTALCALPCIRLHLFRHFCSKLLKIRRYSCVVMANLTKKTTARLHDNLCAVLPKKERRTVIMTGILFICHGNICRSPMAEFVMKKIVSDSGLSSEIFVSSAATSTEELGNDIHTGTRRKLIQMKIPFSPHAARQVTKKDYSEYDFLIVMDGNNIRNLRRIIGDDKDNKVYKLLDFTERKGQDIADPWYTGNFDDTYEDVVEGCKGLFNFLKILPSK